MERIHTEKRRMAILKHLLNVPNNEEEAGMLFHACRALGVKSTPAEISAAIGWLESASLVTVERHESAQFATITREGKDVARGHTVVAGVITLAEFD